MRISVVVSVLLIGSVCVATGSFVPLNESTGTTELLEKIRAATPVDATPDYAAGNSEHYDEFAELDKYLQKTLECQKVPGASVGVVHNGRVVFNKQYGVRDVNKKLPVTKDTLFGIGSTSKAFTGTLAHMLHDEGLLDINSPAHEQVLGALAFDNDFATARVTLRDMMTHRTGLPRHDLCILLGRFSDRSELERVVKDLSTNEELRTKWQYNNGMWALVGEAVGRATGSTWEKMVRERIMAPLGMTKTAATFAEAADMTDDLALPVAGWNSKKGWVDIDWNDNRYIDPMGPAGSINSNVDDMLKWVQFNLNNGQFEGKRLIDEDSLIECHSPHMLVEIPRTVGVSKTQGVPIGYGFGWITEGGNQEEVLVSHSGGTFGHITQVYMHPASGTGVVVLTNSQMGTVFAQSAALRAIAAARGVGRSSRITADAVCNIPVQDVDLTPFPDPVPSPSGSIDGVYEHPAYGTIEIQKGVATLAQLSGPVIFGEMKNNDMAVWYLGRGAYLKLKSVIRVIRDANNIPTALVWQYETPGDASYTIPFVAKGQSPAVLKNILNLVQDIANAKFDKSDFVTMLRGYVV